ncbi:flagellar biosynthesis repressor FlbT [Teichococcus oryzae]|uniref:Flagellar biosynthesis repressor FlbT n=1 Tax=Teichococcus oryzae TaxID=1608942 RepID=A0A5B2TF79_9PROT|nr:flagellar biosynthesis repressor FlbT [Pseudoroseomonas oryzae]KAA2213117.1 flagellar biosynthesis repressor FlbT [Pseudoroseomonas oryzae]
MSTLVLELRQGDLLVVNGAPLRFRNRARVELTSHARFLFGKQIMQAAAATTPARRLYFALQTAYIGTEEERERGLDIARQLAAAFRGATSSAQVQEWLDAAIIAAERDECYQALKLARRLMQHEEAVLGAAAPPEAEGEAEAGG